MEIKEAADLIGEIAESLRSNPSQFHFNVSVNVTGYSAQNSGGIGFMANNSGGTGFNSNMSDTQLHIVQQQANNELAQKFSKLADQLKEIESALREQVVNKEKAKSLSDTIFAEKWVPGIITTVLTTILKGLGS